MKWFLKCIRNYVNFSGRARRTEFWYFILFSCLLLIVAMALDVVCFNTPYGVFYLLVALFLFLPQLAVSARRLHDTGRTSKWLLWNYLALLAWAVAALVLSGLSAFAGGRGRIRVVSHRAVRRLRALLHLGDRLSGVVLPARDARGEPLRPRSQAARSGKERSGIRVMRSGPIFYHETVIFYNENKSGPGKIRIFVSNLTILSALW